MGHWTYVVGLSVYAYDKGGTTAVGVISVLRLLPAAIASPFLATLADRYPPRAGDDGHRPDPGGADGARRRRDRHRRAALIVYAVVILTNLVGVAFRPAQAALLPGLARDPAELSAANVAASTLDAVSTFAGPAIGGIILALWNVRPSSASTPLWFLSSAVLLVGLRAPAPAASPPDAVRQPPRIRLGAARGDARVASDRNVATVTGLYTAQAFIAGALNVLVVLVAFELIDAGDAGVGYLSAALGIGGFVGGFVALVLATRGRLAADFGIGVVLFGVPFAVIGVFASYPLPCSRSASSGSGTRSPTSLP